MNIAFVPARCGSKSIKFKNIRFFCGKPLIFWTLKSVQESKVIDQVVVATDCNKIKNVVEGFGFSKVTIFERGKINASDQASTESVMLEFIENLSYSEHDYLFLVQATNPFTKSEDFDNAFSQLKKQNKDSLLTCAIDKRFFWDSSGKTINYNYQKRPRRQDFSGQLVENGAFYINKIKNIFTNRNRLSGDISLYEMPSYTSIEIDEEDDWIIAELLMKKYLPKKHSLEIKLFLTDVDGTLTDSGMYYDEMNNEFKKFNTRDGMGFEILRTFGIKTGILTSEKTNIVQKRAKKLQADYIFQGMTKDEKLSKVIDICHKENIDIDNVAYIGDDINCLPLLGSVGFPACPADAVKEVKNIPRISIMQNKGGDGAVREFIDMITNEKTEDSNFN